MALLSRFAFFTTIAVLLCGSAFSQALPKAPKAEVSTVTPKPGFFTEPSIAVNPSNPQQVVAAFQDNAHIAYSIDAGRHWQLAKGIEPPNYRVSGDVSVTFDKAGRAYICYIAFDKLGTFNYWGHNSSRNGIYVRRSLDGGATWESHDIAATEQPDESTVPWEDKPYIVADTGNGPHAGNLYFLIDFATGFASPLENEPRRMAAANANSPMKIFITFLRLSPAPALSSTDSLDCGFDAPSCRFKRKMDHLIPARSPARSMISAMTSR
jgi:hypothetical protein